MSSHSGGHDPPIQRNITPVVSPTPQRFGSRTQRVIDDVEEMLGMLEERTHERGRDSARHADDVGPSSSPSKQTFRPPILATSPRRPVSSTSTPSSYATPPSRPAYSRSPSASSTSSTHSHKPLRHSPLKQGFVSSDAQPPPRSKTTPPREQHPSSASVGEYPPPKLATATARHPRETGVSDGGSTTSSEAGRDLLATLDAMQPPAPPPPATPPSAPIDEETTPRPLPATGKTAFSRAWLDPFGAELDDLLAERVTGAGMVMKREMTPVEERTEAGSGSSAVGREGKPLPSTPSSSRSLATPTKPPPPKRATDLIAFFEHAASPSTTYAKPDAKIPGHARGASENPRGHDLVPDTSHARSASVRDDQFFVNPPIATPAYEPMPSELDTLLHPHDSASAVGISAYVPPPKETPSSGKRRDVSPLRNVRNVVAAWRGRLPTPSAAVYDTPALKFAGEARAGNVFEEAFFTIRRMSTRGKRGRKGVAVDGDAGREVVLEKPLPVLVDEAGTERLVPGRAEAVRGKLVSVMTEMTSEPLRVGEIWYLNVHDPSGPYKWIKCDAQLFADRLILTWIPEFAAAGSRGIITLDLVHCLEVRSIPSPNHPSASSDVGSVAAKLVPGLSDNLYPFQLVYEDGVERLGSESARDRVRWVSAVWDILENAPSDVEVDEDAAVSSENGSRSTILHRCSALSSPRQETSRPTLSKIDNRFSRTSDDIHLGDSQTGVLPLKRNSSKHLGRSHGSMLRRVASEADLDLDALATPMKLSRQITPPSSTSSTQGSSGISNVSRPRMTPISRLQASSATGSGGYESAFGRISTLDEDAEDSVEFSEGLSFRSLHSRTIPSSFSSESSERLPSYSSAITVLPVRELEPVPDIEPPLSVVERGNAFAAPMTPPRLPPRREATLTNSGTTFFQSASSFVAATEYNTAIPDSSAYSTPKGSVVSMRNLPLASPAGPREKQGQSASIVTNGYFTATEGSGSYYTPRSGPSSRYRSPAPSSISHAASSLDRTTASTVSSQSTASSSKKTRSRIPLPSFPSSSSSSSTSRTPSSSTSNSTARPTPSSTSGVSSAPLLPIRILETVVENERARVGDTTSMVSQLHRIETAVADIGSFLSIPPALPAKEAHSARTASVPSQVPPSDPGSPSSPSSSSSSSSSDTATRPGTPVEDQRLFRDLASIKDQNRALMDQQLKVQRLLESSDTVSARGPKLDRLEDLLLRLLARSVDSEILMELGEQDDTYRERSPRAGSSSVRSRRTFDSQNRDSMYSDEQGARAPAPAPSVDSEYERQQRARMSGVPESLLEMSSHLTEELDEEWEMQNLPPESPDVDLQPRPRAMPPFILDRRERAPEYEPDSPSEAQAPPSRHPNVDDQESSEAETPRPVQRPIIIPRPPSRETSSESSSSSTTPSPRRRFRPGPMPRPVGIPSPVRPEGHPSVMPPPSFRPGFPYPRPSRLAGVREPMTTTYFRRGFPPPVPMGPMVGPHMGPFMTGVGPGMPGFGGPFGPNVYPRPGYMPPGAAGGDYGLPRRPFFPPRPPRGGSPGIPSTRGYTSSQYSHSDDGSHSHHTDQDLQEAVNHLDQTQHEANDKADALAEAQGQQANEIGRYLHELGSVMDQNRADQMRELMTLHEDIGRIRDQLNHPPPPLPAKTPSAPEPPHSPAVQVTVNNGGPEKVNPAPSPQHMPAAVMNITEQSEHGESPVIAATLPIATDKDRQQDVLLRNLQDKVTELARRLAESERHQQGPLEKIVIRETEYDPQESSNTFSKPLPPQPVINLGPPITVQPVPQSEFDQSVVPPSVAGPPHVHFGPEHVKETTTEVIRGPAGQDIEREIVREFDRTSSEVAAGLPPSHETVIETKTLQRPASVMFGDPAAGSASEMFRDPAGTTLHETGAGLPEHSRIVVEEGVLRPGSRYPMSHAPPSTAAPSVTHVKDTSHRPPTVMGDARHQSIPPTVLGPSDLHNRPSVIVEDHPEGLFVRPVPSKKGHFIDREHPVQLGNMPTQASQAPLLYEIPGSVMQTDPAMSRGDPAMPTTQGSSVSAVLPMGPSDHGPAMHDPGMAQPQSVGQLHDPPQGKGANNKLRKPVPASKVHYASDTPHANVAPGSQPEYDVADHGGPIPVGDMANVPGGDHSAAPAHTHTTSPEQGHASAGNQFGQKAKPLRDRPVHGAGSHVPVVLSTPPLLGQQNGIPADNQTLANIPVTEEGHVDPNQVHAIMGTHADTPSGGSTGRPNMLKKKSSRATPSTKHDNSTQLPIGHLEGDEDHVFPVNVNISNDGAGATGTPHGAVPGHPVDMHTNGRPRPPSVRKGHPAVSHMDVVRPTTLLLPTGDTEQEHDMSGDTGPSAKKAHDKQSKTPETLLTENERLASQSKAKAEHAENERLQKELIQREKADKAKLAADRHQEHLDALADLKKAISDQHGKDDKWKAVYADSAKDKEKRRTEKTTKEKQWQSAFDKLLEQVEADKKGREAEGKKPGADAVIDFLKKSNEDQTAFLRSLAADIMAQNADQHKTTKDAAKAMAREQVAFNVAGYLDDFSKALSGEVRALLKEVGDLRETRRALYYELAELLLLKGRQSAGDLMAVMPWPGPGNAAGPARPIPPPPAGAKPAQPKQETGKAAAPPPPPPAWQSFNIPPTMNLGGPAIVPTAMPSTRPTPPASGSRPLPVPGTAEK